MVIIVTTKDINKMWLVFSKYDREGIGLISRTDFFEKMLQEPRNIFGDALFELVGMLCLNYISYIHNDRV